MKAIITSMGEATTELCVWALERNGFDVQLIQSGSTLWQKLKGVYENADSDFLRVDADVIVNRECTPKNVKGDTSDANIWWVQYLTYDWYKQGLTHGGVQFIKKEALPHLCRQVHEARDKDRPESYMYRIRPFHDPRRCVTHDLLMGIHGYGNKDITRVKQVKAERAQLDNYDFELAERLNKLY
jgi:hypothetical protein